MNEILATINLDQLIERVESVMELFDSPYPGLSESENSELISRLYSSFKGYLEFYLRDLENADEHGKLNEVEKFIFMPAVREGLADLDEPKESMNLKLIHSCLYNSSFTLGHYRSQLNV